MPIKRVVIVHGHAAKPTMYWFNNLARFLKSSGCKDVIIPTMPHPHYPDVRSWKRKLSSIIGDQAEETAIIGHSFGAITALRLAEELPPESRLSAIIIAACPIKWVWKVLPSRILFREPKWDLVQEGAFRHLIVHSIDDWIAPFSNAAYMRDKLACELITLERYHHICCFMLPRKVKIQIAQTLGLNEQLPLS